MGERKIMAKIPGRTVWESDQVVTPLDLKRWYESMQEAEQEFLFTGNAKMAEVFHLNHIMCKVLLQWLADGKPDSMHVDADNNYKFGD